VTGIDPAKVIVNAFELHDGRLRQIVVERQLDFAEIKPIWIDLVAPTPRVREWVGRQFGLDLPDPKNLTDLEASARFYIEDNGELHLHSDFLLDMANESRNVAVAFILHDEILFRCVPKNCRFSACNAIGRGRGLVMSPMQKTYCSISMRRMPSIQPMRWKTSMPRWRRSPSTC
jgi:hypothetical protein